MKKGISFSPTRIVFIIGLGLSVLFAPWFITLAYYLSGLVIFSSFYESIPLALLYDAINDPRPFAHIGLFGISLVLAFLADVVRARLREKDTHVLR